MSNKKTESLKQIQTIKVLFVFLIFTQRISVAVTSVEPKRKFIADVSTALMLQKEKDEHISYTTCFLQNFDTMLIKQFNFEQV